MAQKVFVSKSGKANFSCPECGKTKQLDVSRFHDLNKEVKLKCTCTCKHKFSVILERRKHIRKDVDLDGDIILEGEKYPIKVLDISRLGLKIRTDEVLDINPGDKTIIDFILDDAGSSRVSKEVIVRTTNENTIGIEFSSHDHYDKLGTYILFHFS